MRHYGVASRLGERLDLHQMKLGAAMTVAGGSGFSNPPQAHWNGFDAVMEEIAGTLDWRHHLMNCQWGTGSICTT